MKRMRFAKMSGAGNDFVMVDNRRSVVRARTALARKLCDRHEGIGADGLLLLEHSGRADYRMRYYNADGSDGGMCGNGARCIAWFAYVNGIAGRRHTLEALGKLYAAQIVRKEVVRVSFPDPRNLRRQWKTSGDHPGLGVPAYIDTGSPHAVYKLRTGGLDRCDVESVGRSVRYDHSFAPNGTNVNFVEVHGPKSILIRTYERGVEAETMACGTGSIASALAGSELWGLQSPVKVRARGGDLLVHFKVEDGTFHDVQLQGSARIVYEGFIHV